MCLSKAYMDKDGGTELVMEDVASVKIEGAKLLLKTLFGEQKEVAASIKQIDFVSHSILLENLEERDVSL